MDRTKLPIRLVYWTIIVAASLIILLPLLITFFASLKPMKLISASSPLQIPDFTYWKNYLFVFDKGGFGLGLFNSLILTTSTIAINTVLSAMIAYCLSRFEFKLKKVYMIVFLFGMLVPTIVTETSRFTIIKNLGLYDTLGAPILIYAAADMMQIYIYLQFLQHTPTSLDESARMDGASYFRVFWQIIFPMVKPATATIAIIKFVDVINDMYVPFLYMPSQALRTLTTSLMAFCGERNSQWNYLSAALMLVMIPTIVFYNIFQKQIIHGIAAGALKE